MRRGTVTARSRRGGWGRRGRLSRWGRRSRRSWWSRWGRTRRGRRLFAPCRRAPADRTQHSRTPSFPRPTLFARRHLRLLARSEPAASAAASGRAVVGRRGGRSVHGVPRLEHLSVGLRASSAGSFLLPRGRLASPRSVKLPIQPHPTHIPTAYGQVRRECDIARSTLTRRPAPDRNRSRPYRSVLRTQMSPRSPANRGTGEPPVPSTTGRRAPIRRHPTDPAPHRSGSLGPTDADPR